MAVQKKKQYFLHLKGEYKNTAKDEIEKKKKREKFIR